MATDLASIAQQCLAVKQRVKSRAETLEQRIERYIGHLSVDSKNLIQASESFYNELCVGLDCHLKHPTVWRSSECAFKMLDSFVKGGPSGEERKVVYAVDFGGTNLRVVRVEFMGGGKMDCYPLKRSLSEVNKSLPKGLMDKKATAKEMFDSIAQLVKDVMIEKNDINPDGTSKDGQGLNVPVGFTFSFPCAQFALKSAKLVEWTKQFETGRDTVDPVEGEDVGQLLDLAFKRLGVPAYVKAVCNDTVGTQLSCAYEMFAKATDNKLPPCRVGLILGTGSNACYAEPEFDKFGYTGDVINIEFGNFHRDLPLTNVDEELDFDSSAPGRQLIEKMISGAYLGDLTRRFYIKVFQHMTPQNAWTRNTITTEDASLMAGDNTSNLVIVQNVVKKKWDTQIPRLHMEVLQRLSQGVLRRSAAMAAVAIAAICKRTGYLRPAKDGVTVAVDGSLYKMNTSYQNHFRKCLEDILGKAYADLIYIVEADDGSGKGAAVIALT